jgi:sugar/nucleoside kinase (ribokinase family)
MLTQYHIEPIDYLVFGHLTKDLTPQGSRMGGTASFASLTGKALGMRVGIITSCGNDIDRSSLSEIPIIIKPTDQSTTFENVYTQHGRIQYLYHQAPILDYSLVPEVWKDSPIVHLGPIAQETDPNLSKSFPNSLVVLTPQGFMRSWDKEGKVSLCEWPESRYVLGNSEIAVMSIEDVQGDETRIEEMASSIKILVVTEAANGARVFWNGDIRRFVPPHMEEVDATGAGDIFAAAYFFRYLHTNDPWESARFATNLAAFSVLRQGLDSIPTNEEINSCLVEII